MVVVYATRIAYSHNFLSRETCYFSRVYVLRNNIRGIIYQCCAVASPSLVLIRILFRFCSRSGAYYDRKEKGWRES